MYVDIKREDLWDDLLVDVKFGERDLGEGIRFCRTPCACAVRKVSERSK